MTGEELKTQRKLQGWTQSDLAQKIGVSKGTIINYEKGKKIPESKNKILQDVFIGKATRTYALNDLGDVLNEDLGTYSKVGNEAPKPQLDQLLSKFHPVEIVAYLDKNRHRFFNLEEFRLLTKNIAGTSELEQLKEDILNIKKRLDNYKNG